MIKRFKRIILDVTYNWRLKKAIRSYNKKSPLYKMVMSSGIATFQFISGDNNMILIGKNCQLINPHFKIIGNGNTVELGDNIIGGGGVSFLLQGNNVSIKLGDRCSISENVFFRAQEDNMSITLGNHCLLSHDITFNTSDSHPIYSLDTNQRINLPKPIVVGDDVWIAPNTKIMKGAIIGSGSVIGSDTMVNHEIPCNSLAVGHPAKVVKRGIYWTGEKLFKTERDY